MKPLHRLLLVVVILLAGFGLWIGVIDRPFSGHFDSSNAWWTLYADNLVRYGPLGVRLGDVVNIAPASPDELVFYQHHHPYMLTYFIAPGRVLFGPLAFGTRVMPLVISLLSAAALYLLAEQLFARAGPLALLFFMFAPLVAYYSTITTQELLNLLWITLALRWYALWLEQPDDPRWRWRLYLLAAVGGWTDWVYYLFVLYMILHASRAMGWRRARALWPQVGILALMGGLFVLVNTWQIGWDAFWQDFTGGISMRLTDAAANRTYFPGLGGYLGEMAVRQFTFFGVLLLPLALLGVVLLWRQRHTLSGMQRVLVWLPLLPLATTLTFAVFLREGHWVHDFLQYHLVIPYTLYAAYGFREVMLRLRRSRRQLEPLWASLLLVFLILSVALLQVRRAVDYYPQRASWGQLISQFIQPGERVVGNLGFSEEYYPIGTGTTLAYYAGVDSTLTMWVTPPEDIVDGREQADFYLYCPPTLTEDDPAPEPPAALLDRAVAVETREGCWFLDLKA